jgi:Leucine-rich repeat (LRR) protein
MRALALLHGQAGGKTVANLSALSLLNLSRNKFKRLTSEISKCDGLTEIDLSENRFTTWPKAINNMKNLQRLYLTANSVTDLSDMAGIGAGCLTSLEELSMDMNQIAELPEDVSKLTGLTELSLSDNDTLETLPTGLMSCTELSMLEIDGTEIAPTELPGDLLAFLKEKDVVDLSDGGSD